MKKGDIVRTKYGHVVIIGDRHEGVNPLIGIAFHAIIIGSPFLPVRSLGEKVLVFEDDHNEIVKPIYLKA